MLGAGAFSLGLIEGVAEAAASVLKIVSGWLSDRWRVRRPIVLAGYALSSLVRPLIGLVTAWPQVLLLRFVDRVGKGVRGAPRDAMLARFAPPDIRGRVYGFHRAMDHAGAVAGPMLASLFLLVYPEQYRTLFGLTLLPGLVVILLLLRVPEAHEPVATVVPDAAGRDTTASAQSMPRAFYVYLGVIAVFTLGNSTDAFLLLRLGDRGVGAAWIPVLWALHHVVKSGSSVIGGALSDRWSRRTVIGAGWIVYALVYLGFAFVDAVAGVVALFLVYGLYYGLTEGAEKALVADFAPPGARGTAFGLYNAAIGTGALLASVVFGLIWERLGPHVAFGFGAAVAGLAVVLLALLVEAPGPSGTRR